MQNMHKVLKRCLVILSVSTALTACGSKVIDFKTSLDVQKTSPVDEPVGRIYVATEKSSTMNPFYPITYEEDKLKAKFIVDSITLRIGITNKTEQPITVLWSEAMIASDENNISVPLLTAPRVKNSIYNRKINDKWGGHYQLNDQTIAPQLKRSITMKPDYTEVFSSWGVFSFSDNDFSLYTKDSFRNKQLILTVPIINNKTRVLYRFTLTVIESKVRTSYY
ncbi:hypothetical protein AADZ91_06625 [Colwelliaceae bacterium 6441]